MIGVKMVKENEFPRREFVLFLVVLKKIKRIFIEAIEITRQFSTTRSGDRFMLSYNAK